MRYFVLILFFSVFAGFGQRNLKDTTINTTVIGLNYKLNFPGGDFADAWGIHNSIGIDINNKFKNNLTVGFNNAFLFGNTFKQLSIIDALVNSSGNITSLTGDPANILFLLRGWQSHLNAGYVINKFGNNPNSGIWINGGIGFTMHKTRIESLFDDVPQLEGDYRKGYDRLHQGITTSQFLGYLFQADQRFLNFYAGFEFVQGFTKNVRTYNFDLGGPDNTQKVDLYYGIKVAWMVPIYKRAPRDIYFD
ncbi:MAG: hypothetical protein MK078_03085 [Crocinitomicaceae bacterium]|nr:hypothetical protein [Crocinitomicaceae bacterium]